MRMPMIVGLTTSPIFGGNKQILDSAIVSPRQTRSKLAEYVYRLTFKHILYNALSISNPPFSTNLAALEYAANISNDPYIKSVATNSPKKPSLHLNMALFTTIAIEGTFIEGFAAGCEGDFY
ncbi:hypothetical protein GYMLUDRAFT_983501 [Collybiopsis luxurians FD-317 M1]|nr:hypothetical protein GYMLUDRAFT_983501 [Collybiopsis luxurians FD-317 M1]